MSNQQFFSEIECPTCKSTDFNHDVSRGEITCKRCGLVIEDNLIDAGAEWQAFDNDQRNRRARTGAPRNIMLHDGGLPSVIGGENNNVAAKNRFKYYKMRKLNKRSRISGARERNLAFALSQINHKCSILALPKVIRESAAVIYKKALEKGLIRGRTIQGVVATSIYIACRQCNVPRTIPEISEVSNVTRKEIGRTHRFLVRQLNIKLSPPSPKDYVPRFASELELSNKSEVKAIEIIDKSKKEGLTTGKGPNGVAAAALYIASILLGERKSQKLIAEVAGVTEVTVRNRYQELVGNENMGIMI